MGHIARDLEAFLDFRRVPCKSVWIYVGNNNKLIAKGIRTYNLVPRCSQELILYVALFAPEIHWNIILCWLYYIYVLISIFITLKPGSLYALDVGSFNLNLSFSLYAYLHNNENDMNVWHAKLGYISQNRMQRLVKNVC